LVVIPAEAGIRPQEKACEAGQTVVFSHFRGELLIIWIPASAGMTE
jgi:hypothetical protein